MKTLFSDYTKSFHIEITSNGLPKLYDGYISVDEINEKEEKEYSHNLLCNMQYYMEYCQANGYVTPQEWLNKQYEFY